MKKKIIAMICLVSVLLSAIVVAVIPASAAPTDWIDRDPVENVDYSFAVLGDIQCTTHFDVRNNTINLDKMFTWILKNRGTKNIQYVFGLGDSVETLTTYAEAFRNPKEWALAGAQFARLNGKIPYGVVRGNHDDEAGYHRNICNKNYQNQMDGFFYDSTKPATLGNSMSNSYRKITIGNHKYLMLFLDFRATPESLEWANDLIYQNHDCKVIISVHAYLTGSGGFYKQDIGSSNVDDTVLEWIAFDGSYLWNNLFSQHENIFMVLCGHYGIDNPIVQTRTGKEGNEVIEILVDPQNYERDDPCGTLMLLNFTEGAQKIRIEYFSPSKNKYFRAGNQKTMTLDAGVLPIFDPNASSAEGETESDSLNAEDPSGGFGDALVGEGNPYGLVILIGSALVGAALVGGTTLLIVKKKKK